MKNHIGALPAAALLFCCRIFYLLTYSPADSQSGGAVSMLAFLLAGTVSIGLCALGWGLLRRCGVNSLPELYRRGNRLTAAVFEGITAAVLFGAALSTVMNAAGFLTAAVYPGAGAQVIAAAIVLTAAYGAYSGAEALSRLALPVALVFLMGLLLAGWGVLDLAEAAYFSVPEKADLPAVGRLFWQALVHNTEVLLFFLLSGKIRSARPSIYARGAAAAMLFYQLTIFLVTVTLGPFAYVRSYPIYSMLAAARLSVLGRLDAVGLVVWLMVTFLRCAVYLYAITGCLRRICPKAGRGRSVCLVGLVAAVGAWYLCGSLERGLALWELWSGAAPFWLMAGTVLTAALLYGRRKPV